jgi:hypothetical protein
MSVRVNASATVESLGPNLWRVEVWGQEPFDFVRTYDINSSTDDRAAQEGLRRFVEEMESKGATKQ